MKTSSFPRTRLTLAAAGAAALFAACGGGGDSGLSLEIAQGYAADGATMPVAAANGIDSATSMLETSMASAAAAAAGREQALATDAMPQDVSGSHACPGGGTVAWTVGGGTPTTQANGQLDAGESFAVTYTACGTADSGSVLDGSTSLTVSTRSATEIDFTHSTTALTLTTASGARYVINGSTRVQRSEATTPSGGRTVTRHITSPGISLASTVPLAGGGTRSASYNLRSYDWQVVRTYNAAGSLVSRSHNGSLVADASTPRRPSATLEITTEGTLTLDATDGATAAGSFTIITSRNTIHCVYGGGTATLTLDIGNDGTIDRTWTRTRSEMIGDAG